jgi:uncharacterized protein YdhG (YjbR/CyaY superfamily)
LTATSVDQYIDEAAADARPLLTTMRRLVREVAPDAVEKIRYGMPAYEISGQVLLHFAAAKAHIGVYGLVHVDAGVPSELASYLDHRSTLQFPLNRPLPEGQLKAAVLKKLHILTQGGPGGSDDRPTPQT